MSGDLVGAILRRIDRRQRTLRAASSERVSDRSVSLAAGLSADYLRSLRRQYERGTQVGVTTPAITAIARALKTTPEWLLHGLGSEAHGGSITVQSRPGRGTVFTVHLPRGGTPVSGASRETPAPATSPAAHQDT